MTNHPNRNWRTRMHAACATYLERWDWREYGARMITDDDLKFMVGNAYRTGFESGRSSMQRKPDHEPKS